MHIALIKYEPQISSVSQRCTCGEAVGENAAVLADRWAAAGLALVGLGMLRPRIGVERTDQVKFAAVHGRLAPGTEARQHVLAEWRRAGDLGAEACVVLAGVGAGVLDAPAQDALSGAQVVGVAPGERLRRDRHAAAFGDRRVGVGDDSAIGKGA